MSEENDKDPKELDSAPKMFRKLTPEEIEMQKRHEEFIGRLSWDTYNVIIQDLRNLCQKVSRQQGADSAMIESYFGPFMVKSKCGCSGSVKVGSMELGVLIGSSHYGTSDDEIALSIHKPKEEQTPYSNYRSLEELEAHIKENTIGEIIFQAKPGKLDFGAVAELLRRAADFIDLDQYMKGANGDFAQFSSFVNAHKDEINKEKGTI
jgi:hypothetical protein